MFRLSSGPAGAAATMPDTRPVPAASLPAQLTPTKMHSDPTTSSATRLVPIGTVAAPLRVASGYRLIAYSKLQLGAHGMLVNSEFKRQCFATTRPGNDQYDDPNSALAERLRIVQLRLGEQLTARPIGPVRLISMCAGQGRELFGVIPTHQRRLDVTGALVELAPANVRKARELAALHGLTSLEVIAGDAALSDVYSHQLWWRSASATSMSWANHWIAFASGGRTPDSRCWSRRRWSMAAAAIPAAPHSFARSAA